MIYIIPVLVILYIIVCLMQSKESGYIPKTIIVNECLSQHITKVNNAYRNTNFNGYYTESNANRNDHVMRLLLKAKSELNANDYTHLEDALNMRVLNHKLFRTYQGVIIGLR